MATTAIIGHNSQFQRGNGGGPETFTALGQITNISPPSLTRDTIDATHMQSPSRFREFISGLRDAGEVTIQFDYIRGDANDTALQSDYNSDTSRNYRIVYPGGQTWTFNAFLTSYTIDVPVDGKVAATCTFKINGVA
jgi:predicted secreted protein